MSEPARENKASKANQGFDNIPKFLKILYQLLEDKAHNEHISWSHDGRAIAIKNPTDFAEKLLPIYFKHSNYSSFVRQLNLYSFRKKKHYPYDNTFAHTMFLKGRKDLLKFIKRKNSVVSPNDKSSPKIEAGMNSDGEINELVDENVCLKKVHQDMMEKMGSLEQALKDLNDKNQNLRRHYSKKKQSEEFLKKVVNKMAKVHGTNHIREIIESFATTGFGHSLHLKPKSSNSLEMERAMSNQHNYPYDKCELYSDNSPRNYDYENDRNSFAKSNLTLPPLRTISSLSTNPDLNYPNDFYQNFDQEIDNRSFRQQNLASSSNLKSVLRGLDDFSYAGESRRDCFI